MNVEFLIQLLKQHTYTSYVILILGSYFETLIPFSFFVYGEIFFLAGTILAGAGILNIWIVILVLYTGGITGDSSSYFLGKKYGEKIFKKENKYLNKKNYNKGEIFFKKYGGEKSIFFARLLGPLSWMTPFIAGVFNVKYKNFLKYNIPGVLVGIGEFIVVGYFLGKNYKYFLPLLHQYVFVILFLLGIITFAYLYIRKKNQLRA